MKAGKYADPTNPNTVLHIPDNPANPDYQRAQRGELLPLDDVTNHVRPEAAKMAMDNRTKALQEELTKHAERADALESEVAQLQSQLKEREEQLLAITYQHERLVNAIEADKRDRQKLKEGVSS
jgi:septal ring factor EnvC (AmiA/AmiB activator)